MAALVQLQCGIRQDVGGQDWTVRGGRPGRSDVDRPDHPWLIHPARERLPGAFGDLEADWPPGIAVDDRSALFDLARRLNNRDLQFYQITASEPVVDSEIEKSKIALVFKEFQAQADGPDVLGHE
ncbi:hypothetical protein [Tropicimonas sediminicola]|uniref:Uncharacterized protein n=1 Tax=Tropicimonas sediminicola TaxID=1031541 RepID=A0A239HSF6_9RHOB|nr:hypothetical protein [Tropicimonas sediminicola]SNS84220.1 hypothetical protein SAMN05421757_1044 [Tropicimonas sediminicola]